MGRATLASVKASAIFIKTWRIYYQNHTKDESFTDEVMFVMCDPQSHPPVTPEQFKVWSEILPL